MKKLTYLILIFVALIILVAAPFAGASTEADKSLTEAAQGEDPIPADWPDEPGAMPELIGGKKADRPMVFVEKAPITESADSTAALTIDVWYGDARNYGQKGNPQQWVNIMGTVSPAANTQSLVYSLRDGPDAPLTIGPGKPRNPRLIGAGDFNIEIDFANLIAGPNKVSIKAKDNTNAVTQKDVIVTYFPGNTWPGNYTADWSSSANILDIAQPADGKWSIQDGGLVITGQNVGYDRLVAIGDKGSTWTDYEVTVPITVYGIDESGFGGLSNGPGVGLFLRWQGHTSKDGEQPRLDFDRVGGIGWYRWKEPGGEEGLELRGYDWRKPTNTSKVLEFGQTYIMKMSVQSLPGDTQAYYRLKMWKQGQMEPAEWDLEGLSAENNSPSGSAVVVAHHVDAKFGNVQINRLKDLSFNLKTTTTGTGSVLVNGFPPDGGGNSGPYGYGEKITIKANPGLNNYLESWSGDVTESGKVNPLIINITQETDIVANFKQANPGTLTVNIKPEGAGTVTKNPVGPDYGGGQIVTVTANPNPGFVFSGWGGDLSGSLNPETILIDGNRTIDAKFGVAGNASPVSDDFNRCSLSQPPWSFINPTGKGSQAMYQVKNGEGDVTGGGVQLTVPAGTDMTMWNTTRGAPRIMQATENQDFTVVIKYDSIPSSVNNIEGFLVEQDASNWMRFDIHFKNGLQIFAGTTTNGVSKVATPTDSIPAFVGNSVYMRVSRLGNTWTQAFSVDGVKWLLPRSFDHTLTVKSTGIFAANQNAAAPVFVAKADYFSNQSFPAGVMGYLLAVEVSGDGSVVFDPEPGQNGRYACGQDVDLLALPKNAFTGWSGALTGSTNPATIKNMNADKSVKAFFGTAPAEGGLYLPVITRP